MRVQLPNIFNGQGSEGVSVVEVAPETQGRLIELGAAIETLRNGHDADHGAHAQVVSLEAHRQARTLAATTVAAEAFSSTAVDAAREAVVYSYDDYRPTDDQPAADSGQDAKVYEFPSAAQSPAEEADRLRRIAEANASVDQAHLNNQHGVA